MRRAILLMILCWSAATGADQLLVTVGGEGVTASDLETALASSPFATQFNAMDEGDQAALRGDLLRRLVLARLLYQEAVAQGLDRDPRFLEELENFRLGLLYRHYMDRLRERIRPSPEQEELLRREAGDDADAYAAARAAWISDRYRQVRLLTLQSLRAKRHVVLFEERIRAGVKPETVLAEGDGLVIRYGDVVDTEQYPRLPNPEWVKEQLYKRGELLLVAEAAAAEGIDVSGRLAAYRRERLPALLLEGLQRQWVPDDRAMRDWYLDHPEVGRVLERRHVGQIVLASREEAEAMRRRILDGESLFELAGRYSVDPWGRQHNGDMGWLKEGSGMPQIEEVLRTLPDGEVSEVIETPKGYHLVVVLERRLGRIRPFEGLKDKVRQAMLDERLAEYVAGLQEKYAVEWKVLEVAAQ